DREPIEISLEGGGTEDCHYYRVFVAFRLIFDLPDIGAESLKIILHNSSPLAGQSVWFDGIKLERAFEGQTRPTTYHPGATLHSPAREQSLDGSHNYYE
ncbi:MAG: hypothetical protein PHD82_11920, partial [Candidatus Riflebacteria bacterium]|nr:hypothetical protein [Candidatus Riflebacteria bacterium]